MICTLVRRRMNACYCWVLQNMETGEEKARTQDHLLRYMNTCNQKDTLSLPYNPPSPKNMNTHTTVTCTQNNPTSSLHFHQNIADEVLSSINHASALLHSVPPINHKAHHTAGSVLSFWEGLCCHLFCIHNYTPTALIHTPASRYAHNYI